jgi:hypothetical protein
MNRIIQNKSASLQRTVAKVINAIVHGEIVPFE